MDRDLAELIFKHISIFKYHYPDTKVKVEILDDDIFVLHNDLFLSDDQSYQLLIYSFSREYLKRDYSVFWASDISINNDDISLISATCRDRLVTEDNIKYLSNYSFSKFEFKLQNNNMSGNT